MFTSSEFLIVMFNCILPIPNNKKRKQADAWFGKLNVKIELTPLLREEQSITLTYDIGPARIMNSLTPLLHFTAFSLEVVQRTIAVHRADQGRAEGKYRGC